MALPSGRIRLSKNLDHILLGCRDLDQGIGYMETLSGYRAALGGSHPGRGTRNALLKLGSQLYLEIIAPDPQQKELAWHSEIAKLSEPLLVGYAVRQSNLEAYAASLLAKGIPSIGPTSGSRARLDGQLLRWQTLSYRDDRNGLLPFFIDWDPRSPHPSSDAPGALTLLSFTRTGQLLEETTTPPGKPKLLLPDQLVQLRARFKGIYDEFELVSKTIPSET
jgi:Glyoxalase-like domain